MRGAGGEVLELDVASEADLLLLDAELEATYGAAFEAQPATGWLLAANAFPEADKQAKLERERFLGGIAVRGEAHELKAQANNKSTLMSATQEAARGNQQALRVVENNVATDFAERLLKSRHQTRVRMRISEQGIHQEGRYLTDLHRNAFEHTILIPEMMRRSATELQNGMLFPLLHRKGVFKTHDAVVFSASSNKMTLQQKKDYKFFLDTETCSIQRLSADGDDITLETAFVAGKRTPGAERHDIGAIRKLAADRGIEIATNDATELLGYVFLVPKEELNGVEDVVKWYDDASGGTFYGEAKPRQDYKRYALECEARNNSFNGTVKAITAKLIAEANTFRTALDANLRLDKLSEQYAVDLAIQDRSINEAVFGKTSAMHIQETRFFMERGEYDRAERSRQMALDTADSGSCPWLKNMIRGESDDLDPSGAGSTNQELGEKKRGKCPFCGITVKVDPCAERIVCWDCTAEVNKGKVISTGNGGSNKRRAAVGDTEQPFVLVAFDKSEMLPEELVDEQPTNNVTGSISKQVDAAYQDQGVASFEAEEQKIQVQHHPTHAGKLALAGAEG